jgi:hypothetical protein
MLIIAFATLPLRALCEDAAKGDREFGEAVARTLRNRVADLRAASCPLDLPAGNPRLIDEDGERMAVNLRSGFRLLLVPNHVNNPRDENNRVDWKKVRRVKIVEISK